MNYRKRLNQIDKKLQAMPENDGTVVRINAEWSKVLNPVNGKVRYYIDHRKPFGRKYPENTYGGTRPPKFICCGGKDDTLGPVFYVRMNIQRQQAGEEAALSSYVYNEKNPYRWNLLEFDEDFEWLHENWKDEWGQNLYADKFRLSDEEIMEIRDISRRHGFFLGDIGRTLSGIHDFNAKTGEYDKENQYFHDYENDDEEETEDVE